MTSYIIISDTDNVAVALRHLQRGEQMVDGIVLNEDIKCGHKFALRPIPQGEKVMKYGCPIGHATCDIATGDWVHSHNLVTDLGENNTYIYNKEEGASARCDKQPETRTLQAFVRNDGQIGIRNELWIIPTVGCVVGQAELIKQRLQSECDLTGIDDIVVLSHNYGCSQLGDDHANTRRALAALARHPNAGGVLLLGLGCENNQMPDLLKELGEDYSADRLRHIIAQEVSDEVEVGFKACSEMMDIMRHDKRQEVPLSVLRVGLKCGGSDGFSGITANPLLGRLTDRITACGGTAVLTEVPEMFGAEHLLMNRAQTRDVFDKTVALVNDFKDYFRSHGQPVGENPSPGNKEGGITTLEEKSLGCVQKGGHAVVTDVLHYAERIKCGGLNLLCAPGNDLVASTALAISGCHLVLFSTGRGTPFGTVVPTVKISTNSALAANKATWIDFNAGTMLEDVTGEEALERLLDKVVEVANGSRVHHEKTHAKQITIFKSGVTL